MTDTELREKAAEVIARSLGEQLHSLLKAAFMAGADWERDAIIRSLEGGDGRRSGAGPSIPDAVDPAGSPDASRSATSAVAMPMPRRVVTQRPSTSDEARAVIAEAGLRGIGTPELLERLRGNAPQGGQRDNTVSKALRRLRRDEKVRFDGSLYRPAGD